MGMTRVAPTAVEVLSDISNGTATITPVRIGQIVVLRLYLAGTLPSGWETAAEGLPKARQQFYTVMISQAGKVAKVSIDWNGDLKWRAMDFTAASDWQADGTFVYVAAG